MAQCEQENRQETARALRPHPGTTTLTALRLKLATGGHGEMVIFKISKIAKGNL